MFMAVDALVDLLSDKPTDVCRDELRFKLELQRIEIQLEYEEHQRSQEEGFST